jgi:hypothetical protein
VARADLVAPPRQDLGQDSGGVHVVVHDQDAARRAGGGAGAGQGVRHRPTDPDGQVQLVLEADQVDQALDEVVEQHRQPLGRAPGPIEPPDSRIRDLVIGDRLESPELADSVQRRDGRCVAMPTPLDALRLGPALRETPLKAPAGPRSGRRSPGGPTGDDVDLEAAREAARGR